MRMIVPALSQKESAFVLALLNSAGAQVSDGKSVPTVSDKDGEAFDKIAERLRRQYERGKVSDLIRPRGSYFVIKPSERTARERSKQWGIARFPLTNAVVNLRNRPGNFVHVLIVGVPAHRPPVMINNPIDLVNWLIARAMANRQLKRFVKCSRDGCGKFGMRARAKKDARFCSEECQRHFNAESRKLKSAGVFGSAAT